ncbi:MAG: hypothetical protein HW412_882 [Bacteroidetes bacterium]|nr:hypothetical protein [Bacteroidota bacterium]
MDSVFQELKRSREAKKLSIVDVADATLINPSFLEAIEQGNTTILPQTYIRAFIREYATVVGLDPVAIMQRYDNERTEAVQAEQPKLSAPIIEQKESKETEPATQLQSKERAPTLARFALPSLVLVVLAIVVWNLTRTKQPETNEAPFNISTDTLVKNPAAQPPPPPDSLTLKATTTDSAWVQIIIDDLAPREYLFRPNRTIVWKARDKFRISVGNPTAVHLTLNDKPLGAAGKRGTITRNVELNRQTLQK